MYVPNYHLSEKLLLDISQIERIYGRLEALRIPKKLELNLERNNLVQSTYFSNSIEGNPLSLLEVTNILLGDRVPVNRDEKEIHNYYGILKNLDNYISQKINLDLICSLHQKMMYGVNDKIAGKIRNKTVVIGRQIEGKIVRIKHNPPYHTSVVINKSIKELSDWLNQKGEGSPIIKSGIFHHQFLYIHPFEDGNGRIGRLLTALIFLQNKYIINKYFVLDDYYDIDRITYSDKLHSADDGDKTEWLEYFADGIKYSLESAHEKYKNAVLTLTAEERLTSKEKEILAIFQKNRELTSFDLAKILKVSRQQSHHLLASLLEKGFLNKKGTTKGSYYFLK